MNDEAWGVICNSLKAHPTLEVLNLCGAFRDAAPTPAMLKSRIQALVDMLKVNLSIHTILFHDVYSVQELFRGSVIPSLETNRFRPRLLAKQSVDEVEPYMGSRGGIHISLNPLHILFWDPKYPAFTSPHARQALEIGGSCCIQRNWLIT
jgi:hypothetical protein